MIRLRSSLSALAACALIAAGVGEGVAVAGTYTVLSCDSAPDGFTNNAWTFNSTGPTDQLESGNGCADPAGGEYSGLYVRERFSPPDSDSTVSGHWTFNAPASTSISAVTYSRHLRTFADDGWRTELRTDATVLEECVVPPLDDECDRGVTGGATAGFSDLNASQLRVGVRCTTAACIHGASLHRAIAVIYGSQVTISDTTAPSPSALTGTIAAGGWLRGSKTAVFSASDSTGIDVLRLTRPGHMLASDDRACDFTRPAPCASPGANVSASWGSIDTSQLPDGTHTLTATALDVAGNPGSSAPITVSVDNTAPSAPKDLAGASASWSSAPSRSLFWVLPDGQASPIAAATVRLCPPPGGSCTDIPAASLTSQTITLGSGPGTYTGAVFLTDDAGNVDAAKAAAFTLRFDPDPPAAPTLDAPQPTDSPGRFRVAVSTSDAGPAPLESLVAEVCRVDGRDCRPVSTDGLAQVVVSLPSPGSWQLRVRARDAAANAGPAATTTVTYTPPEPSPSPTVDPQPTPTPTVTPRPTTRSRPSLRFVRARVSGQRLRVLVAAPRDVAGRFELRYRLRIRGRAVTVTRGRLRARAGRLAATLRLPSGARAVRRGHLQLRFAGDARYRPRTISKTVVAAHAQARPRA